MRFKLGLKLLLMAFLFAPAFIEAQQSIADLNNYIDTQLPSSSRLKAATLRDVLKNIAASYYNTIDDNVVLFQFSTDATTWHDAPAANDIYARATPDGGSTWSNAILLLDGTNLNVDGAKITNLTPGTAGTDAVNVDQLAAANITTDITNFNKNLSATDVNVQLAFETIDNLDIGVDGTGTANIVPRWNAATTLENSGITDNSDANAITINSSEYVGIGSALPLSPLFVEKSTTGYLAGFRNSGGYGLDIRAATGTSILLLENGTIDRFRFDADGGMYAISLPTAITTNILYFDNSTGKITYGAVGTGSGDMLISVYDAAGVTEQLVGLTATQSLVNKSINGVTLDNTGLSSLYLDKTGVYSTPAGGSGEWTGDANGIALTTTTDNVGIGVASSVDYKLYALSQDAAKYTGLFWNTNATGYGLRVGVNNNSSTSPVLRLDNSTTTVADIYSDGKARFYNYGSGTFSGTATYNVSVDANGNLIETANPAGGGIGGSITNNQIAFGSITSNNIEGSANLIYDGANVTLSGNGTFIGNMLRASALIPKIEWEDIDGDAFEVTVNNNYWILQNATGGKVLLQFTPTYQAQMEEYGIGTFTGTPTYNSAFDTNGKVIETPYLNYDGTDLDVTTGNVKAKTYSTTVLNGAKTANFSHDASAASRGAYQVNLAALTLSINNLSSGMSGAISLNYITTAVTGLSVNTYSDVGVTGLTEVVIGNAAAPVVAKTTVVYYSCVSDGTNTYVEIVFGQQ